MRGFNKYSFNSDFLAFNFFTLIFFKRTLLPWVFTLQNDIDINNMDSPF